MGTRETAALLVTWSKSGAGHVPTQTRGDQPFASLPQIHPTDARAVSDCTGTLTTRTADCAGTLASGWRSDGTHSLATTDSCPSKCAFGRFLRNALGPQLRSVAHSVVSAGLIV